MKDNGRYVVVAIIGMDATLGGLRAGLSVWSHEFRTRVQAEACMVWLKKDKADVRVTIFDDFVEE